MKASHYKLFAAGLLTLSIVTTGCGQTQNKGQNGQNSQQRTQMQQTQNGNQMQTQRQQQTQNQQQGNNRIEIANQMADKIVKVNGVRSANVLVTNRNAYVAAVIDANQGQLSRNLEDQIASQVRSVDPNVQNVYVSTNPEFVDRVNAYVNDVRQGRPVAGFFAEFTEMVQRIFPTAR